MAQRNRTRNIETVSTDPLKPLAARVTVKPNGCWAFDNDLTTYGKFHGRRAHRWVYEQLHGHQPPDVHLHHRCLNPGCVNPWHLAPMSPEDHSALHAELRRTG